MIRPRRLLAATLASLVFLPHLAAADKPPAAPLTIVVPTPPGGPLDIFARALAQDFAKRRGGVVTVENKPGAGTALGAQFVGRAKPDGLTLLMANIAVSSHAAFKKAPLFNVEKDLQPLTMVAYSPYAVISSLDNAKTLESLISVARSRPGELNFGIIPNSQLHIDTVRVLKTLGINARLIPYNGTAPIIRALLAKEIDGYVGTMGGMQPHFDSGRLHPLATTGAQPWPGLATVPTLKSKGHDLVLEPWYALFATAGLPAATLQKLRSDLLAVMETADFKNRVHTAGYEVTLSSAEALGKTVADNLTLSRQLVTSNNITPE